MCMQLLPAVRCPITRATPVSSLACVLRSSSRSFYKVTVTIASSAAAGPEGWALAGLGLDDVHTPRGLSHSMPSDDSQLDALEHSVDVAAVQNSLAHMSMPHGGIKNSRRPQANSPGGCMHLTHPHEATRLFRQLSWRTKHRSSHAEFYLEHTLSSTAAYPVRLTLSLARASQPVNMLFIWSHSRWLACTPLMQTFQEREHCW